MSTTPKRGGKRGPLEQRIVTQPLPFNLRDNGDGTFGLRGYFAVFDSPAYGETIDSSAFTRTIAQRDDVRLLVNHTGVPLARTKSGTLTLGVDQRGGWFDVSSLDPANPAVQELISALSRGDIDQCSFAGYWRDAPTVDGLVHVREVELTDVSIVTYPWYDETSVALTGSRDQAAMALALRSLPPGERQHVADLVRAAPPGKQSYGDRASILIDAIVDLIESTSGVDSWYVWVWIDDLGDDWCVYSVSGSDCYMQVEYSIDAAGVLTLGVPFEVERVTQYLPVTTDPDPSLDAAADRSDPTGGSADPPARAMMSPAEARALLGLRT